MKLDRFLDIHTHNPSAGPGAIVSLRPGDDVPPDGAYSVGIHPWDTGEPADLPLLECKASLPQVVAIGEAGLDALRGAPLDAQERIFCAQIELSERLRKPLVIHAVRTLQRIIELRIELGPEQQWIIHGFRGKPQQAEQLLRAGIDISLGEKFNPLTAAMVPPGRLYAETDTSATPIAEIRARIAACRNSTANGPL